MIRGSEDAVVAALVAVKAVLAAEKQAAKEEAAAEETQEDKATKAAATEEPVRRGPTFPVVPVGASREAEESLLAAAGGKSKMDKNARRRARKREQALNGEPEWADGLPGLTSTSDVLAKLMGSSTATPAPAAAAPSGPAKRVPPPPPGLGGPDPLALLAQHRPYGTGAAAASAPAPAPSSGYYVSSSGFSVRL